MSIGLRVNLGKARVIVAIGITKDSLSKSKVDPCGVCNLRIKGKSVLCVHCDRCARLKRVIALFKRHFACKELKVNIREAVY